VSLVEALDPKKWDQSISPFRLPKGLRLVLADVDAGTNTPSFIRGILKWREEKPEESNEIWGKLFKANTRLVKALEQLRNMEGEEEYSEVLEAAAGLPIEQVRPSLITHYSPLSQHPFFILHPSFFCWSTQIRVKYTSSENHHITLSYV